MNFLKYLVVLFVLWPVHAAVGENMQGMSIYPVPTDIRSEVLTFEVRQAEGDLWQAVPLTKADSMSDQPHAHGGAEAWVVCAASGALQLRVTAPVPVVSAVIRPSLVQPIDTQIDGHHVTATIAQPGYVVIELNHDAATDVPRFTVYLMIEKPETLPIGENVKRIKPGHHAPELFASSSSQTLLLLPGVHTVEGQMIQLSSQTTLYLQGGAYLRSYVHAIDVEHVDLKGHGVIDGTGVACKTREWRDDGDAAFVLVRHGKQITWDGPTIYDSPFWNSVLHGGENIAIRHYKSICWKVNNDGIQPRNCNRLVAENCFLKCADDCVAIKSRRTARMTFGDLTFRDLVLWNDKPGNGVEIGHTSQADQLSNVLFENIHVVHAEGAEGGKHVISIFLVDHCTVQDVTYRDFYVEGFLAIGDIGFQITQSRYSTDSQRGHIRRIKVDGYHKDQPIKPMLINDYDSAHRVQDVSVDRMGSIEKN